MHFMFQSPRWTEAWPGATLGQLVITNVNNPASSPELDARARVVEEELRAKYGEMDRAQLKRRPVLFNYWQYYGVYDKTYHVQGQLESVVHKNKPIKSSSALVQAMFMAELEDLLLTAVHDLDKCAPPYSIDIGNGLEEFTAANGEVKTIKPNDMYVIDKEGIISSVLYGQDQRTLITPETKNVMFITYGAAGVGPQKVTKHLRRIMDYVKMFSPDCNLTAPQIQEAN